MGRRQNELKNTAGLVLKLRIILAIQALKISFYKQILVPAHFWLVPPHFASSGDGTDFITLIAITSRYFSSVFGT